jgi:hypothetical protein
MHDDEPCTVFFYYLVLDCPTTIYGYKRVYALSFAMHVFGMGIVVLGVSGVKPAGEGVFGYFGGGELETTDLGSGIGVHSSVYLYFDGFWSLGVGVLLADRGHELAPV